MNPRYAAYAAAHGRRPDEMLSYDADRFPGGRMAGFMIWMSQRWTAFAKAHGLNRDQASLDGRFDEWLSANLSAEAA